MDPVPGPDRRQFLKGTAALAGAAPLVHAGGSDTLRVGVIGCGGRGTGAAMNAVSASPGIEIAALGDVFEDRLAGCAEHLAGLGERFTAGPERRFAGFDAYGEVLASGVDLVILATPPHFRPAHLAAAVDAGVHVFTEKPVAVDAPGVRAVLAAAGRADERGLAIVAGTQRRHQAGYLETMRRVHEGAIGGIVAAQCHWNQGGLWMHPRRDEWSDVEWQLRNWLYFTWLSGDHIVEQHMHNLDVINWALGAHPLRAVGMGGRQVRTDPAYGNVFDHFAVEYEYPGGVRVHSFCRQIDGCAARVAERLVGEKGTCDPSHWIRGETSWRYDGDGNNPYEQEHADLVASIRAGEPLNEARAVAESSMTAILGRMSTYTGEELGWDQALASEQRLGPERYELGELAVEPVAVPGVTPFV